MKIKVNGVEIEVVPEVVPEATYNELRQANQEREGWQRNFEQKSLEYNRLAAKILGDTHLVTQASHNQVEGKLDCIINSEIYHRLAYRRISQILFSSQHMTEESVLNKVRDLVTNEKPKRGRR
jgi:hypothetical protein